MAKILVLQGLPASGKSTYAKKLLAELPAGYALRINNDELSKSMFGVQFGGGANSSKLLRKLRNGLIRIALANGYQLIIVDNTNLATSEVRRLERLSKTHGVEFEINNSFLEVSVSECLTRNSARENPIPENVILEMSKLVKKNKKRSWQK
jgi:predicted kinase